MLQYRATIKRFVTTERDGEKVRSLEPVETGVLCRLEDLPNEESRRQTSPPADCIAFFLLTTDLRPRRQAAGVYGDILEINRVAYEVLALESSEAQSHRLVARLMRIGPAPVDCAALEGCSQAASN